jgi:hypothetical protein
MKLIEGKLFLTIEDAIECGFSKDANYINKEKSRGAKWATFIKDPQDNRKTLIEFESLAPNKKEKVLARYGNPYDKLSTEPIKNLVIKDLEAEKFYMQYRFDGDKSLPIKHVEAYTKAASWLNMLVKAEADKKELKKLLNLNITQFWVKVCEILSTDNIDLPSSIIRLRQKIDQYKESGYQTLIHKQFGYTNAKKVNSEVAEALLLELIGNHNQLDDVFVCFQYNKWASINNHKQISPATVGNYRRTNEATLMMSREGNSAFNEKYILQQKGFRPSAPNFLWEHDDNNLDFLFSDSKGYNYHRYVCIAVTDSHCDLLLGKSYIVGHRPESWMVKAAYIDAMYYVRSLTGGWYMPFEIKADNWNKDELTPLYHKIGKYVRPAHGNKHRGYIEPFFSSGIWKRMQKAGSKNYNGNNMAAKFRGVNMEALEKVNLKFRPKIGEESEQQIESFFHRLRNFPDITRQNMNALSKQDQWLQSWESLPIEKRRPITDEQFLLTFGIEHNPSRQITITNRGIEPQINGVKYSFDIPSTINALNVIGSRVSVIYDPYDMSRVLITNHTDIRFIAKEAQLQPRALQDTYTGSRTFLNALLAEKKKQVQEAGEVKGRRERILEDNSFDAEAVLQAGVLSKVLKNKAEMAFIPAKIANQGSGTFDPLEQL